VDFLAAQFNTFASSARRASDELRAERCARRVKQYFPDDAIYYIRVSVQAHAIYAVLARRVSIYTQTDLCSA
jgi:hypothetical protein